MFVIIIYLLSIYYNVYIDYKSNYRIANNYIKKSESDEYWFKAYEKRNNKIFYDSMIKRTIKRQNSNGKLIRNLFEQKLWDRILLFINEYEIIEKIQFYY